MKIGVLGTGTIGQTIASKLTKLDHEVLMDTRDVTALMARTEVAMGRTEPFSVWIEHNPKLKVGTFEEAAVHGEIVSNATSGQ